jgi:hypothetical protein
MSSKYKVVISNTVIVPVSGHTKDGAGRQVPFRFSLICTRKGADELKDQLDNGALTKDVLREVTTDWRDQRLVLEQDDTPAVFNADAFDALLDIAGMATLCFNRYYKENGAAEKN